MEQTLLWLLHLCADGRASIPIVKMEGTGRRHCKSRKLMVIASCSGLPVFHTSDYVFHALSCLMTPTGTIGCSCLVDYQVFFVYFVICLWFTEVRGGGGGRSCGVGENRGTDIGMPQAVSLLPFLLALMGYGECHQTILITLPHVWKAWPGSLIFNSSDQARHRLTNLNGLCHPVFCCVPSFKWEREVELKEKAEECRG